MKVGIIGLFYSLWSLDLAVNKNVDIHRQRWKKQFFHLHKVFIRNVDIHSLKFKYTRVEDIKDILKGTPFGFTSHI